MCTRGWIGLAGANRSIFYPENDMKIRIKGNSIRYRLSRTDVTKLTATGALQEETDFGTARFVYALKAKENIEQLQATLGQSAITLFIPQQWLQDWEVNTVVGFNSVMPLPDGDGLFLLVEKDFKCLDNTIEDQSDNFENPNQTC
jgi:hypothetical protein